MTIRGVRTVTEERRLPSPPPDEDLTASPVIHSAPDYPFRGWQPPQPDGYTQSAGTSLDSAIVIDNGVCESVWQGTGNMANMV